MKNNMRILLVGIFLVLLLLPISAVELYENTKTGYKQVGEPFFGTNVRLDAMGGAGLGVKGTHDSYLLNPANLAKSGFKLSLPAITITAHNPQRILASGALDDFLDGDGEEAMLSGAQKLLGTIQKGYGDFLTTDVATTFTVGGFGLSVEAQERLMTYKSGADLTSTNLLAQVSAAATLGFGMNFKIVPKVLDIDVGVSAKAVYKAYLQTQNANTIIDMMDENSDPMKKLLNQTPLMAGWAVPISVGMNLNFPFALRVSAVAKNLNGTYRMTTYESVDSWAKELFGTTFNDDAQDPPSRGDWEMEVPWSLDFGFAWTPSLFGKLLEPTIAIDVVDVISMSGNKGPDLTRAFFEQTRLGASVRVLRFLDLRYGINKGYQSLGVGLDLLVFHIDAAYYIREYGQNLGDKPIDALSVRFSIGSR